MYHFNLPKSKSLLESNILSYYHIINFNTAFDVEIQTDFLPLDSSDMNISVQSDQSIVVSTAKKLKEEFEDLLLLVKRSVSDIDLDNFILRLNWSLSSEKQNTQAVQEHLDNLEKLPTAKSVLNYLINRNFIGYLNYELLKVFQKEVQSDELQSGIKHYEQHHDAFLRLANFSTIVDTFKQHPELAPASPIGLPQFTVRFEAPWEGKSIYSWKELLQRRFNWPPHINIVSISRHCIILVYSVLPFFAPALVRDLTDQKVLALLEREGLSVELSSDLLQLRDDMEAEISEDETIEDKLLIGVENLKLSTEDKNVSVSRRSETELTSFSEEDGEGKETSDGEVVKAKTISILEQV